MTRYEVQMRCQEIADEKGLVLRRRDWVTENLLKNRSYFVAGNYKKGKFREEINFGYYDNYSNEYVYTDKKFHVNAFA